MPSSTIKAYKATISYIRRRIVILKLSICSGPGLKKATQDLLKGLVANDPEADAPKLGVLPLFPTNKAEFFECDDVYLMFHLDGAWAMSTILDGTSPLAANIRLTLDKLGRKQKPLMEDYGKSIHERLRAIIDPCLAAKKSNTSLRLELCHAPRKGKQVQFFSETRYLVTQASYTIRARNARDDIRDYLAIQVAAELDTTEDCEAPLLAHMALIHRNRKERGEANSVVHGISTDSYQFSFWRIDNNSQVFLSERHTINSISRRYDDHDRVVSYIDHILNEMDIDCQ